MVFTKYVLFGLLVYVAVLIYMLSWQSNKKNLLVFWHMCGCMLLCADLFCKRVHKWVFFGVFRFFRKERGMCVLQKCFPGGFLVSPHLLVCGD